jgi:hypothetical protein
MIAALATIWVLWASAANYHGPTPPRQFADKATCEQAIQDTNLGDAGLVCLAIEGEIKKPPPATGLFYLVGGINAERSHPRDLGTYATKVQCEYDAAILLRRYPKGYFGCSSGPPNESALEQLPFGVSNIKLTRECKKYNYVTYASRLSF